MARRTSPHTSRVRPLVGLGLCVVDHLYEVDDFALATLRTRYHQRLEAPGGMVANALVQGAALGCRTQLLSVVGDDVEGRWLLAALRARGVGTRHVVRSTAHPTTTAVLLVERGSGERRFIIPDRRALERSSPDVSLRAIRRASILLVDGHYARQAAAAIARARELGAAVVADLSDARPAYLKLLRGVDFPILPLEFAASWGLGSARATLRALHERFGGTPVLTLGAKGALAWVDGRVLRVPPHPVRVRDSTGAGDAFHGAFAAGLAHELGIEASLRLAARAGAEACRALGASASLLSKLPARLPTPLPKRLPKSSS